MLITRVPVIQMLQLMEFRDRFHFKPTPICLSTTPQISSAEK